MCGICGLIRFDGGPIDRPVLEAVTRRLSHRGPDGEGVFVRDGVGLGHRRLAIIDPDGGAQPMSSGDGSVWITYNGELYNHPQLRRELEGLNHRFRTRSDTETIVHSYQEWGDRCVERFRGMFAFGIVDFRRQRVLIARDHLGIKPLYYVATGECFAFASELHALRGIPGQPFSVDLPAIDHYLQLQYIPAPRTCYREVRKLLPAHRMGLDFDGRTAGPEEYWRLEFRPDERRPEGEWVEALDEVVRDSVRAHLISDVPFGAFLSGGVDSSAIVAHMAHVLKEPVRTFSIGFDEKEYDETGYAAHAAKRWGTEHRTEIVTPDALAILPELVRRFGEPFGDSSAIPTYFVSRLARRHVPMVLSGDGGDELFAGYNSYSRWLGWLAGDDRNAIRRPLWKRALRPLAQRLLPGRYRPEDFRPRAPTLANWLRIVGYGEADGMRPRWRPEHAGPAAAPLETFEREFARSDGYSAASRVQYLDCKTYLPYDILTKVDIASMANGLEVRTPLVDVRVAEFAATIPQAQCIGRGPDGGWAGKKILKQTMRAYYPAEFLNRKKQGFAIPIRPWCMLDDGVRGMVRERLTVRGSLLADYFEPESVAAIVAAGREGPVWLLLVLEEWLRQNSDCRG